MSLRGCTTPLYHCSGPRASGDEPVIIEVNQETVKWSPRERG